MNPVRIGIIGLGNIAQVAHLPILSKLPDVRVTAACDINRITLSAVSEKFAIPFSSSDFHTIVNRSDVDAIFLTTPTDSHCTIACAALGSGKHLFIEKPIALSMQEAVLISEAAEKNDRILMIGMNHRFRQDILTLKSFISNGELGSILFVRGGWLNFRSSSRGWITEKARSGGGVVYDLGIVMLDLILWLLSFPRVVGVTSVHHDAKISGVEESASSFFRLEGDTTVTIDVSWNASVNENSFYIDIVGTKGSSRLSPLRIFKMMSNTPVNVTPLLDESMATSFQRSYEQEIKHFLGAMQGNFSVLSTGREAVERMRIVECMYQSAKKRREIVLSN